MKGKVQMDSNEFLKRMKEAGEKYHEETPFVTVARMKIQFGYSGMVAGERAANFFKPCGNSEEETKRVSAEVSARLKKKGSNQVKFAVMLRIPEETNTSTLVTWDIEQVTFANKAEDSEYQILFNTLFEGDFPIDEWFWGSYKNEEVGKYKNREGETKKRYLSIPVDIYPDEATAKEAIVTSGDGAYDDSQWSDTARANYNEIDTLEKLSDEINDWLQKAKKGIPFNDDSKNYPLPVLSQNMTEDIAKEYIAQIYECEPADIDLLVPF
jgi:hypothetical protein